MLGVFAAVVYDKRCTPSERELGCVREVPSVVGLESILERRIELRFTPRAAVARHFPGRLEIELHEAAPPAFEALAPFTEEDKLDPDFVPRALSALEFADGVRVDLSKLPFGEEQKQEAAPLPLGVVASVTESSSAAPLQLIRVHFTRPYRARRRGRFALGALAIHIRGPLGLARRSVFFTGAQTVRVEPAMAGLKRTLQLVASQRWWDLGVTRQRHARGGQTEFESLRNYVPGDEPRTIDWKAYARRGKPMVRQYEPERGQEVILLFDCGRRMGTSIVEPGIPEWTKLDHALDAGLEFAAAVLSQGDRVGLLAYDSSVLSFVAPARSGRQLLRLKEAVFSLEASAAESQLADALDELNARHRRRALVIVLSDVADPLGVEAEALALAHSGKNRIVFCAFDDPDLVALASEKPEPGHELEAAAAVRLADERLAGLTELAKRARVLNLEATRTAGPLLSAWFQERRML